MAIVAGCVPFSYGDPYGQLAVDNGSAKMVYVRVVDLRNSDTFEYRIGPSDRVITYRGSPHPLEVSVLGTDCSVQDVAQMSRGTGVVRIAPDSAVTFEPDIPSDWNATKELENLFPAPCTPSR